MNTVIRYPRRAPVDAEAVAIGALYKKSITDFLEAGKKLIAKRQACARGEWLLWLDNNAETLGFRRWTAQRLIKIAEKYAHVASHTLDATTISRELWGHTKRITTTSQNAREPSIVATNFDRQLLRLQQAWAAAGADARKEFLHLVLEQIG